MLFEFVADCVVANSRKKTVWNWLSKKAISVADSIDPSHHLSDLLSSSNHKRSHAHQNSRVNSQAHGGRPSSQVSGSVQEGTKAPHGTSDEVQLFTVDEAEEGKGDLDTSADLMVKSKKEPVSSATQGSVTVSNSTRSTLKVLPVDDD